MLPLILSPSPFSFSSCSNIHPFARRLSHPFFSSTKYPFFCRTLIGIGFILLHRPGRTALTAQETHISLFPKVHWSTATQCSYYLLLLATQTTQASPSQSVSAAAHTSTGQKSTTQSTSTTSNQPFSKRSPPQFQFLPRLTSHPHPIASHTIHHTPYILPPSHSLGPSNKLITFQFASLCRLCVCRSLPPVALYLVWTISTALLCPALLCVHLHCTYAALGKSAKSLSPQIRTQFSYTDSPVVCVVCAAIPRLSLSRLAQLSTQTHRQPPRRRRQLIPFALERYR